MTQPDTRIKDMAASNKWRKPCPEEDRVEYISECMGAFLESQGIRQGMTMPFPGTVPKQMQVKK